MFHDYLAGRPYPRDTRKTDSLAWLFSFQSCAPHVALLQVSFSRNPLIFQLSLSLHQLNTKSNTIKFHKIQVTKLKQLQHFLSWNKVNIRHSCKSQLYNFSRVSFIHKTVSKLSVQSWKTWDLDHLTPNWAYTWNGSRKHLENMFFTQKQLEKLWKTWVIQITSKSKQKEQNFFLVWFTYDWAHTYHIWTCTITQMK